MINTKCKWYYIRVSPQITGVHRRKDSPPEDKKKAACMVNAGGREEQAV
jgi:hypothetical protein